MDKKLTLVLGASENEERYSNMAVRLLRKKGFEVAAIGNRSGKILDVDITTIPLEDIAIDTVTLYLSPENQKKYIDYILKVNPRRIIFNPGTENPDFQIKAKSAGILTENACTLVLLNLNDY